MIKRVKLDENGYLTEIDWKAIRRIATELKQYVQNAPLDEVAKYQYHTRVLPLLEAIFNKTVKTPFPFQDQPYDVKYEIEGIFPKLVQTFSYMYSELICRLCAMPGVMSLSIHETGNFILDKDRETDEDGNVYELCWFED